MIEPNELAHRCAATLYARDAASQHLGITISGVAPGQATARMRITETMLNGHGVAHGGYLFLLADTAFAFACNSRGPVTVAAGAEMVFVTPATLGDELVATATERVRYGRSGVSDVTVHRADGTVIAEFRGRSRSRTGSVLDATPPAGVHADPPSG
ncbi:MAG: hydroxyphenylacetyl-CoA thioesterase PaaI [Actinobacteria bacterium]|nr:hydroxyphenylacetyl-CoA thioesterase PaaI [Actinomycetota bacterium]MBI3685951.1 hydroxyphenylacetyl-CoA thioesterase PaaI [Actinomycetota bacterium]